jgi:hypothetical protein
MSSSAARRQRAAEEKAARKLEREPLVLQLQYQPGLLTYHGPIITTGLAVSQAHADALTAAGEPVPPAVTCRFLIDTGADGCVVKHEFAVKAGLKLINANTPLAGVGVDTSGKTYIGRILFGVASKVIQGVQHQMAVDTQVMSGDLKTELFDGLIGRDVLQHFVLTYDGKTGLVTMRYHKPGSGPTFKR